MHNNILINSETVEATEKKLISEILNKPSLVENAILKLEPSDFLNKQMAIIFGVIFRLHTEGKIIDEHTIITYIEANKELHFDDFHFTITKLANEFVSPIDIDDHIDIIKEASIKRQMDRFAEEILSTNMDITTFDEQMWNMMNKFSSITSAKRSNKVASMKEITNLYSKHLQQILTHEGKLTGTPSGFSRIDSMTNGFQPGELIILAARPGIGKTALALNFLTNAAIDIKDRNKTKQTNEAVLMFSLEMSSEELCNRIVANLSMVDLSSSKRNNLSDLDRDNVYQTLDKIAELPIFIDDDSALTIMDVQAKIKQFSAIHKIKLVVIDYLGLLKGPSSNNANYSRQMEISMFSRTLKQIARTNNIPIVVLSQLNRNLEQRKGGVNTEPMLSDLRDSGAIEQDADIVTFLYSPKKEDDNSEESNVRQQDSSDVQIEYIIAKNRKGPIGRVQMIFHRSMNKFTEQTFTPFKGANESKTYN